MGKKRQTKKQLEKKIRDAKIKSVYESLPDGTSLQEVADMFKLSVSTIWYAIYGRKPKSEVANIK